MGLLTTGIGTVAAGINLIVTIFTLRAPGMTMRRLPLFVWMVLINCFLIIWALPGAQRLAGDALLRPPA